MKTSRRRGSASRAIYPDACAAPTDRSLSGFLRPPPHTLTRSGFLRPPLHTHTRTQPHPPTHLRDVDERVQQPAGRDKRRRRRRNRGQLAALRASCAAPEVEQRGNRGEAALAQRGEQRRRRAVEAVARAWSGQDAAARPPRVVYSFPQTTDE